MGGVDIYARLAKHLEGLVMAYPFDEALIDLLKEMFSPEEARVALAIPNDLAPLEVAGLDVVLSRSDLPRSKAVRALESLAGRNLLFTAETEAGAKGYALLQMGYGFPQTFFWGGKTDEHAAAMAGLVRRYFSTRVTHKAYGSVPTKTYKYSPANLVINPPMQGVLPHEQIGPIVQAASRIAVAHCGCRMSARVLNRHDCRHSLEVCLKYDEMAEFVISRGLARKIGKDEALHILERCEKEGLVHMVDNAGTGIKHTCNCCGCYCWNVGILRRRKIPRDALMAVYFARETEKAECTGCGTCMDICPVDAVRMVDDRAEVDMEWCIGCGVCAVHCPEGAISIRRRSKSSAPVDFSELHGKIRAERLNEQPGAGVHPSHRFLIMKNP